MLKIVTLKLQGSVHFVLYRIIGSFNSRVKKCLQIFNIHIIFTVYFPLSVNIHSNPFKTFFYKFLMVNLTDLISYLISHDYSIFEIITLKSSFLYTTI